MRNKQRSNSGINLLEMVVAIALSGVFVVMLSGMLAQTLALSVASQNQIIAGAIADQLVEQIQCSYRTTSQDVVVNPDLQLDLAADLYGTYNGGARWTDANGNQFKGSVKISGGDSLFDNLPCKIFDVTVTYHSDNGGLKTVTRKAFTFDSGTSF